MTKAFLKMARAQARITALREALALVRHNTMKDAEREILLRIAEKRPIIDDWKRQQEKKMLEASEAEYREAHAPFFEDE